MAGVSWSTILKLAPRVALGLVPGLVNPAGGVARAAERSLASSVLKGAALTYPELNSDFVYPELAEGGQLRRVINKRGKPVETRLPAMNGNNMSRENINAVLAQSLEKHNKAVAQGEEKNLVEWWPNEDTKPRRAIRPESTAVKGITVNTDGSISIQFRGGGKWYTYHGGDNAREASEAVKDLLLYPSIGRAINRRMKYRWADSKHVMNDGKPLGGAVQGIDRQWGEDHYAPDWASLKGHRG